MAKRVMVAGAGPAGLMAMWACLNFGYETILVDIKPVEDAKPPINAGVFILHAPCDLPLRKKKVQVYAGGAHDDVLRQAYSSKVYGQSDINVSIPAARYSKMIAWDGAQAIDLLWDIAQTSGSYVQIVPDSIKNYADITGMAESAGCVGAICTIPMNKLVKRNCLSQTVYVKESTAPADEAYIMYNANQQVEWYRCSAVFGRFSIEAVTAPSPDWTPVHKVIGFQDKETAPVRNNSSLLLTGRQGAWDKKLLVHDSYYQSVRWLQEHHR